MTGHEHVWVDSGLSIDTYPPTYTWTCSACGAASHDGGKTVAVCCSTPAMRANRLYRGPGERVRLGSPLNPWRP
jgi:hypothetical protein